MEIYNGEYCVYVHTNKTNDKKYVGQTCQKPERRWNNGHGYKTQPYFYRAIQKYGWDGFEHEVIATHLTKDEANNFERLLIMKLDTMNPLKGYNSSSGGDSPTFSEGTKRKMSESAKKRMTDGWIEYLRKINTGRKLTDKTKKKLSDAHKGRHIGENNNMYGRHHTEEAKRKISEASKKENLSEERLEKYRARKGEKNPFYGKKHTEESKRKISENHNYKTGKDHPMSRKIIQYDKEGNFIKTFDSITQAAEEIGTTKYAIWNCLSGKNHTCKGYVWRYYNSREMENNE